MVKFETVPQRRGEARSRHNNFPSQVFEYVEKIILCPWGRKTETTAITAEETNKSTACQEETNESTACQEETNESTACQVPSESNDLPALNTSRREDGKPQKKKLQKKKRKVQHKPTLHVRVLFFGLSMSLVRCVSCTELKLTAQHLPKKCIETFSERFRSEWNCPDRKGPWRHEWETLHELCCLNRSDGTQLHCMMNVSHGLVACLKEGNIPEGYNAHIHLNGTGYPELTITPCPVGQYRSGNITSTYLRHEHCDIKSKGNNDTQELACDGGESSDEDRFICRVGFEPWHRNDACSSTKGFLTLGLQCGCTWLTCPPGQHAFRNYSVPNPVPKCDRIKQNFVEYGCTPDPVTSSSTQRNMPAEADYGTTPRVSEKNDDINGTAVAFIILGTLFALVVLLTVCVFVGRKICKHHEETKGNVKKDIHFTYIHDAEESSC